MRLYWALCCVSLEDLAGLIGTVSTFLWIHFQHRLIGLAHSGSSSDDG